MRGTQKGLADFDTGVENVRDLTPKQRIVLGSPEIRERLQRSEELKVLEQGAIDNINLIKKAEVHIGEILKQQ